MTSILSIEPWTQDPRVVNIPWRSTLEKSTLARAEQRGKANDKQPLKLGIFWTDGVVKPQPPITRGLHIVAQEVKNAGHKVCSQN
jgi:amidase